MTARMIGVFDSGLGGLTILRGLVRELPERSFVYLGDNAHAPYGDRAPEDIYRLTIASLERLFGLGCRLIVIACNTASAIGLRRLQQTWLPQHHPGCRVLGVLVPTVEAVTGVPWMATAGARPRPAEPRTVAVFATRHTVRSGAFVHEIGKRAPEISVVQQACPRLVPLIEQNAGSDELRAAVEHYAGELMTSLHGVAPRAAILGCTHYPLLQPIFAAFLPASVELFSQPRVTARSLRAYLARHPDLDTGGAAPVRFYTSGPADSIASLADRFYGERLAFQPLPT